MYSLTITKLIFLPTIYGAYRNLSLTTEEVIESVFRTIESSFHETSAVKLSNSTLYLITNASFVRYIGDAPDTFKTSRVVPAILTMKADIDFVAPCQREIDGYVKNNVTVYAYSFDYFPESPIFDEEQKGVLGKEIVITLQKDHPSTEMKLEAFHGLDHAFIFSRGYTSNFEIRPFSKEDEMMAEMLTKMITNFAKNGDPSTKSFTWPPFNRNTSTQLASINLPPTVIQGESRWPYTKFWNVEVERISRHISKSDVNTDADADITIEERVQPTVYRRAWVALWLLMAVFAIFT
ncbi:hypothetical protein KIN20_012127 [Parelaphostrongylus tenuis]|uniref:Carboxylesterase type B domain-containing protein n=1 Tax=Parelaphostrongylus tenuis TaxID=148309 RepID=A0AAD5QLM8_PARTN|nr:hypothetical protein KIN20_012127 [Parelaphostrongylus tenuis]